jgi:hypothetical protein
LLEEKDREGSEEREMASPKGAMGATAIFILSAVAAVVLAVFDTPVEANPVHDFLGGNFVLPEAGEGKGDAGGFFEDAAFAQVLGEFLDADELGGAREELSGFGQREGLVGFET